MACQPKAKYTTYKKIYAFFHFLLIIHLIFNWNTHLKVFGSTAGFWGCGKAPVTGEKQLWSRIRRKKKLKEKNCKNQAIGKSSTIHTIKNLLALCFKDRARVNVSTAFAPRPLWWFLMAGRIWRQNKHLPTSKVLEENKPPGGLIEDLR